VNPPAPKATIYYYDIGDYLSREQKLDVIRTFGSIAAMRDKFTILQPNKHGDLISHRDEGFEELIPLAPERKFDAAARSVFTAFGGGLKTNRDAWVYQFSKARLDETVSRMVDYYNRQASASLHHEGLEGAQRDFLVGLGVLGGLVVDVGLRDSMANVASLTHAHAACPREN
jgi:predicted helicase